MTDQFVCQLFHLMVIQIEVEDKHAVLCFCFL